MEDLNSGEVVQLMEMLDISENSPISDRQLRAGKAADQAIAVLIRKHGTDEMLGACSRFLRRQLFEAVERC